MQGVKSGSQWIICQGGGFLIGEVDNFDNVDGDEIVYLYPDLKSSIIGSYRAGQLVSGRLIGLKYIEVTS